MKYFEIIVKNKRNNINAWEYYSMQLEQLIDPMTNKKYKKLKLNPRYWNSFYNPKSSYYNPTVLQMIEEITFCSLKFMPTMELFRQSVWCSIFFLFLFALCRCICWCCVYAVCI